MTNTLTDSKRNLLAALLIAVAGLILYLNTINHPFVYDDLVIIRDNRNLDDIRNFRKLFTHDYFSVSGERSYRPVSTALAFADVAIGGRKPAVFRATSIAVHLAAGIFVFLSLLMLTKRRPLAFLAALFFVLHPIQTEAVNGASFIEDPLSAMFFFAAFYLFLKGVARGGGLVRYAMSAALYLFAMFAKESAIVLPVAALAADWAFRRDEKFIVVAKKQAPAYLMYAAAAVFYVVVRFIVLVNRQPGALAGYEAGGPVHAFAGAAAVLLEYFKLFFYPARLSIEHCPGLPAGLADWRVASGIAAFAALLILGAALRRSNPAAAFGSLFFAVNFLPVSGIVPFGGVMAERYMYLPSFGLCLFTIALFMPESVRTGDAAKKAEKWNVIFSVCFIVIYGITAFQRNYVWRDELYLWRSAIDVCPASSRAQTNYGRRMLEVSAAPKDVDVAEAHLEKAVRLDPANYEAALALGTAYLRSGDPEGAVTAFEKAYESHPTNDVRYNLGIALNAAGRPREALLYLNEIFRTQPEWPAALYLCGNAYLKSADFRNAERMYRRVLELDPGMTEAKGNLSIVYMQTGREGEAELLLNDILKSDPKNIYAIKNMEIIRLRRSAPKPK